AMIIGVGLAVIQADLARRQTDAMLTQTYLLQLGTAQTRERTAFLSGLLQFEDEAGRKERDRRIAHLVPILVAKTRIMLKLDYVPYFLGPQELAGLQAALTRIETEARQPSDPQEHRRVMLDQLSVVKDYVGRISGTVPAANRPLMRAGALRQAAERNNLLIVIALILMIVTAFILYHRNATARRVERHLRSFASMFTHMTRTRFAAMQFFVEGLSAGNAPEAEMLLAARATVTELRRINEGLANLASAERGAQQWETAPLGDVLDTIARKHAVHMEVADCARRALVPQAQFELLLDELVLNARDAGIASRQIEIRLRGRVAKRLLFRRQLELSVIDNGAGMGPGLLEKAIAPFYSTKAAQHTGLGLADCIDLLKSMKGKLTLKSEPGVGTEVQIVYPL
ncbi:MAG: sensor histidine kinase, partial [Phyllobacterium sp.]